jgi:hypothetical protein
LIANSKAKDLLAKALLSLAYQRRLISTLWNSIIYVMFIETLLQYIYTESTSPKYY